MAYRNGTYIAFHANKTTDPTASDIKYYNLLKAWTSKSDDDFSMINSHEKTSAVRDSSLKKTLQSRLVTRLKNLKNFLLIVGNTTKEDTDWVPFEVRYAVDSCDIPIIAAYTMYSNPIYEPSLTSPLANYWPAALTARIKNGTANVIHVPFKKAVISEAIGQFSHTNKPKGNGLGWYNRSAYQSFGMA